MLVIGNKKFRNLQEQVGYNTERIDDILAVLDGLNIQDNVVVIDDISTDLTLEEIAVVKQPVAFLIYNGSLYIKKNEDSDNAYFDIVFTITANTVISFSTSEIQVYLATGALSITNSTVSTYSNTQIDTLLGAKADITYVDTELAKKANLAGANFTGGITAPSVLETMSGYSWVNSDPQANLFTKTFNYVGVAKTGNKITFAIAVELEAVANVGAYTSIELGDFTIPSSVGSRLFPYSQGVFTNVIDTKGVIVCDVSNTVPASQNSYCIMRKFSNTKTGVKLYTSIAFTAGDKAVVRYEATFLLGDSLAS